MVRATVGMRGMKMRFVFTALMFFVIGWTGAAQSEPLKGQVEQVEVVPRFNLQLLTPQLDRTGLSFKENCVCIDPQKARAVNVGGRWQIMDGDHWLIDFGGQGQEAEKAAETIRYYGFTDMCAFGPGGPSGLKQYFLVTGASPVGPPMAGEDALPLNSEKVEAVNIGGRWKVVAGKEWLLDFDRTEQSARQAAEILQHYGFQYSCYVGRPGAPMSYYRK